MTCDCEALAASIVVRQAAVTVAESGVTVAEAALYVANQQLNMAQMQLWYDQYNFYLCGCGGSGMTMAEVEKAIVERDLAMVSGADTPLRRMHRLVMVQIEEKRKAK